MKKLCKRLICLILLAALCLAEAPAFADDTGTLTITIGNEKSQYDRKGIRIALYKVGSEVAPNDLQLDAAFSGIDLYGADTTQKVKDVLKQIRKVLIDRGMDPVVTLETDEDGKASVGGLRGIYYGIPVEVPQWLTVQDFLTSVPLISPGVRNMNVDVSLKGSYETPTPEETTARPTMTPGPTPGPHKLIIHYIYADTGETAAPDYNDVLWEGEEYDVWSPIIPNYWYDIPEVVGVMPDHDMEYTVLYFTKKTGWRYITLEDYETALGIGMIQMHVGVCYE